MKRGLFLSITALTFTALSVTVVVGLLLQPHARLVEVRDEPCIHVLGGLPCVVGRRVASPADEVLRDAAAPPLREDILRQGSGRRQPLDSGLTTMCSPLTT